MSWLRSESPATAPPSQDPGGSDTELVAQARQGDPRAFALLSRRYLDRSTTTAAFDCVLEAAEDATQTIFLKALRSIPTCRYGDLFAGWLFPIVPPDPRR